MLSLCCFKAVSAHLMPRATPQGSACFSSVHRLAEPTCRWECFRRSLAVCTERPKLMREADRQSGETSWKTDVIITIATSHHRHRSSPSLSPPPSPSEITGPIGREEGGHQRQRHGRRHRRHSSTIASFNIAKITSTNTSANITTSTSTMRIIHIRNHLGPIRPYALLRRSQSVFCAGD